jgi:hypothetical protein
VSDSGYPTIPGIKRHELPVWNTHSPETERSDPKDSPKNTRFLKTRTADIADVIKLIIT